MAEHDQGSTIHCPWTGNCGIGNVRASKSCEMLNFMQMRGKNPEQQPISVSQASQAKVVTDKRQSTLQEFCHIITVEKKYCRLYSSIKYRHLEIKFAFSQVYDVIIRGSHELKRKTTIVINGKYNKYNFSVPICFKKHKKKKSTIAFMTLQKSVGGGERLIL